MASPRSKLIFFHGLNTFGDDLVHIGPFTLGAMHGPWARAIENRYPQIEFIPILGLGAQTLEAQAAHALVTLRNLEWFDDRSAPPLHFLGQSTGGLVARRLAHHPDLRELVKTVITIGTPHHGAGAAEYAVQTSTRNRWLTRVLKLGGYDLTQKQRVFADLTREATERFNHKFDHRNAAPCVSLICEVRRSQATWPLQFFYTQIHALDPAPSDGFIASRSQMYDAEMQTLLDFRLRKFELDHFAELGYCLHPRARDRLRAVQEFDRLIEVTARIVSSRSD